MVMVMAAFAVSGATAVNAAAAAAALAPQHVVAASGR
jgi:hypothetical protein